MGLVLPALYHWSPSERRASIRSEGLKLHCRPVTHGDPGLSAPYLCFSPTASCAFGLSGGMEWVSEIDEWDLWQVRLVETDEVHYRNSFGPVLEEIRVYNAIPADRLWWVGSRQLPHFEECR